MIIRYCSSLLVILILTGLSSVEAQEASLDEITYEVNRVYPPLSFTMTELNEATSLEDINPYYKPTWIDEFITVDVTAVVDGKAKKVSSKDDQLSHFSCVHEVHA